MWSFKKYFGLSRKEMRTVQEIIYQNIAMRENKREEFNFSSFSFNRARLLEFLGEVIKWSSRGEELRFHFEVLRKLVNYELVSQEDMLRLAEIVDNFIVTQLIEVKEDNILGSDLAYILKGDQERLRRGLEEVSFQIPEGKTLSISLEQAAPHQKPDITYAMMRTILDIAEIQRYAVRTQSERVILAKVQQKVPISKEDIDVLINHVECFRYAQ